MKKIALLLAIITLLSTNCNYLRKKGIIGEKKRMKEYIDRLENTLKDDSLEYAARMEQMKKAAQSKIDSIQKCCGMNGNYHVITGSFRNPLNAEGYVKEMKLKGYKSQIVMAPNGFNLVSAFASNDYNDALNALNNLRTSVIQDAWLYVKN
jgi:cell division protein FtsN